jgi:predicted branched-subunit amino acid permease
VGVAGGEALGDPRDIGLDGAFPALFLALLVSQLVGSRARLAALVGAGIAFALTPFTPAGTPIVAAAAACLLGLRLRAEPRRET